MWKYLWACCLSDTHYVKWRWSTVPRSVFQSEIELCANQHHVCSVHSLLVFFLKNDSFHAAITYIWSWSTLAMSRIKFRFIFPGIVLVAALLMTWLRRDGVFGHHELRHKRLVFLSWFICILTSLTSCNDYQDYPERDHGRWWLGCKDKFISIIR